ATPSARMSCSRPRIGKYVPRIASWTHSSPCGHRPAPRAYGRCECRTRANASFTIGNPLSALCAGAGRRPELKGTRGALEDALSRAKGLVDEDEDLLPPVVADDPRVARDGLTLAEPEALGTEEVHCVRHLRLRRLGKLFLKV